MQSQSDAMISQLKAIEFLNWLLKCSFYSNFGRRSDSNLWKCKQVRWQSFLPSKLVQELSRSSGRQESSWGQVRRVRYRPVRTRLTIGQVQGKVDDVKMRSPTWRRVGLGERRTLVFLKKHPNEASTHFSIISPFFVQRKINLSNFFPCSVIYWF